MSLLYLCQRFCLRSVCLGGKAGETEPKLMVVLSTRASLSCLLLEMALLYKAVLHPHGSRGLLVLAVGQWEGQLPQCLRLFFFLPGHVASAPDLLEHRPVTIAFCGSSPGQEGSFQLWVRTSETLHTNKPCEKGSLYRALAPLNLLQSIKWAF